MREYYVNGVPIEHLPTEQIRRYARDGVSLLIHNSGKSYAEEQAHAKARLIIELFIREHDLRSKI